MLAVVGTPPPHVPKAEARRCPDQRWQP
jgi:hypothetical protein